MRRAHFDVLAPDDVRARRRHKPNIREYFVIFGVLAFWIKVVAFCWLQILIRWTMPRFRYDQLMALGWKGLVPLGLLNVLVTAFVVVLASGAAG